MASQVCAGQSVARAIALDLPNINVPKMLDISQENRFTFFKRSEGSLGNGAGTELMKMEHSRNDRNHFNKAPPAFADCPPAFADCPPAFADCPPAIPECPKRMFGDGSTTSKQGLNSPGA